MCSSIRNRKKGIAVFNGEGYTTGSDDLKSLYRKIGSEEGIQYTKWAKLNQSEYVIHDNIIHIPFNKYVNADIDIDPDIKLLYPDIITGFNDSQYDWNFIVVKALSLGVLPYMIYHITNDPKMFAIYDNTKVIFDILRKYNIKVEDYVHFLNTADKTNIPIVSDSVSQILFEEYGDLYLLYLELNHLSYDVDFVSIMPRWLKFKRLYGKYIIDKQKGKRVNRNIPIYDTGCFLEYGV